MAELIIALSLYLAASLCMIAASVDGIRYARVLRLDWPIYLESGGWLAVGLFILGIIVESVYRLAIAGVPETFRGVSFRSWFGLLLWLAFTAVIAAGKHIAVRNAYRHDASAREAAAKMHNAMFRLSRVLDEKPPTIKPDA